MMNKVSDTGIKELTSLELSQVSGGWFLPFIAGWAGAHALDYMIEEIVDCWEDAVEDGWGQDVGTPPKDSNY